MVEIVDTPVIIERTEREIRFDGWVRFFERFTNVAPEDIPEISTRATDISMDATIENQAEFDGRMDQVYKEFGIEVRNSEMHLGQESLT